MPTPGNPSPGITGQGYPTPAEIANPSGTPAVGDVPTWVAPAGAAGHAAWQAPAASGTPGAAIVRGPFSFAFNTAGLAAGVTFYTPTIGDILLDAWIELDTLFDGTTPMADIGTFVGTTSGFFGSAWNVFDLAAAPDSQVGGTGYLWRGSIGSSTGISCGLAGAASLTGSGSAGTVAYRAAPGRFVAANPLKLVASQDGTQGGTAINSTVGAGRVYIVTATPVALP